MKLGKEEIQKLSLGLLLFVGMVYSYFSMLLFPEMAKQASLRKNIAALGPEITASQAQIKKGKDLETTASAKSQVVQQVHAMIPEGSPVAWFPPRMAEFFKRQGIDKTTSKMNADPVEKLAGFRRLAWSIDLPRVDFGQFGAAVCAMENEELLMEITNVQIETSREDPESQHAVLTVHNLIKK